jgi:DNA-directed RNA polymerase subunit omega
VAVLWFSTALAVGLLQPHTLGVMDADTIVSFDAPAPPPRSSAIPMKKDLVEKAAEIVPDPLILVNLVSKRVAQLNQGRSPLVDVVPSMGFADVALTEIIEGKIKLIEVPKP